MNRNDIKYQAWQHGETGRIVEMLTGVNPGPRYYPISYTRLSRVEVLDAA